MGGTQVNAALGQQGINVVDDPLVAPVGALTVAQNAATSMSEAGGSLLKRSGFGLLALLASDPILAILSVPLVDASPGSLIAPGYPPLPLLPIAPVVGAGVNATSASLTVTWKAVTGATGYRVDVATDTGFVTLVVDDVDAGTGL